MKWKRNDYLKTKYDFQWTSYKSVNFEKLRKTRNEEDKKKKKRRIYLA